MIEILDLTDSATQRLSGQAPSRTAVAAKALADFLKKQNADSVKQTEESLAIVLQHIYCNGTGLDGCLVFAK